MALLSRHAPGSIKVTKDEPGRIVFTVEGWPRRPYDVLVVGIRSRPRVTLDGNPADLAAPHRFSAKDGWLTLHVSGKTRVGRSVYMNNTGIPHVRRLLPAAAHAYRSDFYDKWIAQV